MSIVNAFDGFAAIAAQHAEDCKAAVCHRCSRYECACCGEVVTSLDWESGACAECLFSIVAAKRIPIKHRNATLRAPWLGELAGVENMALAHDVAADNRGALFVGETRAGKTSLATAIMRERATRTRERFAFMSSFEIGTSVSRSKIGDEPEALRKAKSVPLLLIDELGGEDASQAPLIWETIYTRNARSLTTYVTTGLPAAAIDARYGSGALGRLREDGPLFKMVPR